MLREVNAFGSRARENVVSLQGAGQDIYPGLMHEGTLLRMHVIVEPDDLHFDQSIKESTEMSVAYQNYELLYGGRDDHAIYATYREFTEDDLAKPAFYQNLVYQVDSKYVRFRSTRIEVHEATSEKIEFTVLDDSIPEY